MSHAITPQMSRFHTDESGAVALMFGLTAIMLAMFAALAVDLSRVQHERSRVASALDAAALAAGKAMLEGKSVGEVRRSAQAYFERNVKVAEKFGTIIHMQVHVDPAKTGVKVEATVEVPMTLARIGGFDKFTFPVVAETTFKQQDIELSMALDVTGSMRGAGKLDALKAASNDLFDILLPNGGTAHKVRIALAPYSSGVNAGAFATTATGAPAARGCTFERQNTGVISDATPGPGTFFSAIGSPGIDRDATCPTSSVIVPLTSDKRTLRDEVAAYSANGSTAGHLGVQWAWNMLSPDWSGIFGAGSAPVAYGDGKTRKAMVLMTDGLFNTIGGANHGDFSPNAARSQQLAKDMCAAMRTKGITIYAVGFKLDEIPDISLRNRAAQTLQECAGDPRNYFDARSATALREAFQAIGEQVNNLRLTN